MKRSIWVAALFLEAACGEAGRGGGGGGPQPPPGGRPAVEVTADVLVDTAWSAENIWVIDRVVDVRADLTLPAGTILKFGPNGLLRTGPLGTIVATGSAAAPVVLTSLKDDVGGDTNGDGAATQPAPGDWHGVEVTVDDSSFAGCEFRFAGRESGNALWVTARANVTASTFRDTSGPSDPEWEHAALEVALAADGTVVTGNTFLRNALPLRVGNSICLGDSNSFGVGAAANGVQAVRVSATTVLGACTWSEDEVPYVVESILEVAPTGALNIGPGVIVKMPLGATLDLWAGGSLNVGAGAAFTSIRDDARGGDTNGDGNASAPALGDWAGLWSEQTGTWTTGAPYFYAKPEEI